MEWLWILAFVMLVIGMIGSLLPVLPGVPLVFAGLWMMAWLEDFTKVSLLTLTILACIALAAWAVDFIGAFATAKKVGASKQAIWGIAIGSVVGIFFGVIGLIIAPAIGAMLGEWLAHRNTSQATTVGIAAGMGFVLASIIKFVLMLVMLAIFAYAYYF